ncbi:MAG: carbohydrate ABC transporter permease [Oscillospiraceae bacterium]|nr:carbohydrate ABC transporter permease [Oscillospiraceae bacterium]
MPALHDIEVKGKYKWLHNAIIIVLILGIPFRIFPFSWMITNMFKDSLEVFRFPPRFFPDVFQWNNISDAFAKYNLAGNLWNSVVLCAGVIAIQVPTSALAAFSLSRLKPKGSKFMLLFFVGTMMINSQAIIVPTYIMMGWLGLINSFWSVILSLSAWGWSVFVFKGFFDSFPRDLMEAARIDGASNIRTFGTIVIPLTKPVFSVVILNTFRAVYNQFMFPLMLLSDDTKWTIMIRIYAAQEGSAQWNHVMVMLTFAVIPIVLFYLIMQKNIVQGITMTGLKG